MIFSCYYQQVYALIRACKGDHQFETIIRFFTKLRRNLKGKYVQEIDLITCLSRMRICFKLT